MSMKQSIFAFPCQRLFNSNEFTPKLLDQFADRHQYCSRSSSAAVISLAAPFTKYYFENKEARVSYSTYCMKVYLTACYLHKYHVWKRSTWGHRKDKASNNSLFLKHGKTEPEIMSWLFKEVKSFHAWLSKYYRNQLQWYIRITVSTIWGPFTAVFKHTATSLIQREAYQWLESWYS